MYNHQPKCNQEDSWCRHPLRVCWTPAAPPSGRCNSTPPPPPPPPPPNFWKSEGRLALVPLLILAVLLLTALPAGAQTDPTLVSNTGESNDGVRSITSWDHAQGFTTGSNTQGYKLTAVDLSLSRSGSGTDATFTVNICSAETSGLPPTSTTGCLGTLTTQSSVVTGINTFTHSGIDLTASTTYFVFVDTTAAGSNTSIEFTLTNSNAEDSGAAAGWSIADDSYRRLRTSTGSWTNVTPSRRIAIHGSAKTGGTPPTPQPTPPPTPSTPAVPAGLTITAGEGSITLRWNNPGDSSITRYEYSLDGSTWIRIPGSGPGTTSHTVTGLTPGRTYTAQLRAVNANGSGGHADSPTATPSGGGVPRYEVRDVVVTVTRIDTVGWARFERRFGYNCWDEMAAAVAAAEVSSGRTPEDDELARCQRFLAEDIKPAVTETRIERRRVRVE
ncbi:choice-of-anchor R domain-containing protein [Candidatus Palauibacter sp.]|uniref:choice-of-anchor R domain-containing protein n=1 Tax=Candidatus Palauibacter sp. TaxID=3101350 RepID=UPI003B018A1A